MPETANKPGRILLLQWSGSAYDSLRGFLRLAGEEFAADGHEVHTVVIDHPGWQDKLNAAAGGGALFALGMSVARDPQSLSAARLRVSRPRALCDAALQCQRVRVLPAHGHSAAAHFCRRTAAGESAQRSHRVHQERRRHHQHRGTLAQLCPAAARLVFAAAEELYHRSTADFLGVLGRLAEPHGLLLDGNSELT
ncbi:MAG: hypothetical protein IPO58_25070 [Betaproteobacteria bacterium]|nr:hypothetical protein [Betaproteobacteria bacterium]